MSPLVGVGEGQQQGVPAAQEQLERALLQAPAPRGHARHGAQRPARRARALVRHEVQVAVREQQLAARLALRRHARRARHVRHRLARRQLRAARAQHAAQRRRRAARV